MSEAWLRTRKATDTSEAVARAREIQGMLAMQDLETGRDAVRGQEATGQGPAPFRAGEVKPLPYRQVLATWPDDWRERWGRRANELEESGLPWRDAEGRAFVEVWSQLRAAEHAERN